MRSRVLGCPGDSLSLLTLTHELLLWKPFEQMEIAELLRSLDLLLHPPKNGETRKASEGSDERALRA